jgi:hypothetical protein
MSRRDQKNSTDRAAIITGIDRRRTNMKKRWLGFTGIGILLVTFFFSAVPARAENVDEEIRALKEHLARLEAQQFELKREATAATDLLPTFSYRPGAGMMIEAADKSWSFRASMIVNYRLEFESGLSEAGRETGGVFGRRFRPYFFYCVNNCFYEIEAALDLDGFGTGNAKNSTNTATSSILERGAVYVHFENLNPWLPTYYFGMDTSAEISQYDRGSSQTSAQAEHDLLRRNNGFNTGRAGNGMGWSWRDLPLSGIGIPGRIPLANIFVGTIGEGDDGLQSFREQRSVSAYLNIEPFTQLKNKWIQGLGFEMGAWICPNDPNHTPQNPQSIACNRLRIQDNGDGGRQTLFDSQSTGSGLTHYLIPGFSWAVGPYRLRAIGGFNRDDGQNSHIKGTDFLIANELFLWSPKGGFLSGNSNTAGSILFGTHFERTDVSCPNPASCNNGVIANGSTVPQFKRDAIILREWDLWYFLAPRMSVGATWWWYDVSNLRQAIAGATNAATMANIQAATNVARNLGCVSAHQRVIQRPGEGCQWTDFHITWRYQF